MDNIRRIIKERGLVSFDSFTAYHKKFESMLFMDTDLGNRSPMSIFNQAVCIKDVKDLTQFIREHMLDDGGSKEKLLALQERFDDLRSTHRRIETAACQLEQLEEIKETHDSYLESLKKREHAEDLHRAIEPYYAQSELDCREELVDELKHQEEAERARLKSSRLRSTVCGRSSITWSGLCLTVTKTADSSKSEPRWTACVTRGKSCPRGHHFRATSFFLGKRFGR